MARKPMQPRRPTPEAIASRALAILLAISLALPARAADRQRIATINVAATTLFTYLSCVVQKKARPRVCLSAGAVAGLGFYQAKRLAGKGDITTGWLVANLATSVVENTTAGEHPLSRLGYTFGPMRLRVATPFDAGGESLVDVDLSLAETGYLIRAFDDADDVDIRDGMIWWETENQDRNDEGTIFNGYTWGIYPGTWRRAPDHTWSHEAVHAIQAMQLDSVEPPLYTVTRERRLFRVRHIRGGAVNVADNLYWGQRDYEDRWAEIEAFRLSTDTAPPR